jgi:hypothetical protein
VAGVELLEDAAGKSGSPKLQCVDSQRIDEKKQSKEKMNLNSGRLTKLIELARANIRRS